MKTLLALFLVLTSLKGYADDHDHDHNENPYKEIIRLQQQVQDLKEQNMKYDFCVNGLLKDIGTYANYSRSYGMLLMVNGMKAQADADNKIAQAAIHEIIRRCSSLPNF
jgi:hypothetical protein